MEHLYELRGHQVRERTLVLDGGWEGQIWLTSVLPGVVQVRLVRGTPWSSEAIVHSLSVNEASLPVMATPQVWERADHLLVGFPGVTVRVQKRPFRLAYWATEVVEDQVTGQAGLSGMAGAWVTVAGQAAEGSPGSYAVANIELADPQGAPLLVDGPDGGLFMDGWQVGVKFNLHPQDQFFGLGEPDQRQGEIPFNHKGKKYPVWNKHLPAPSRLVMPVLVSQRGYGIFVDNGWPAEWDLGADGEHFSFTAQGGQITYYFIAGPELPTVLDRYTRLTGRPSLAPKWSFGLLQSKFGYQTRAEVHELVATFQAKQIPLDCVILDLFWFKYMGDLAFNKAAFPDPKAMVQELKAQGVHIITIEEPYVTKQSRLYPEAERLSILGKRADGSTYTFPFWAGETALMDFTQPLAKQWWADQHKPLLDLGIDGWWTDLNEPEEHPQDMIHAGGIAPAVHNSYVLHMLTALKMAQEQHKPEGRLFILSRSGWPGTQALGAGQWSGDVATRWDALQNQIPLGLSMAMVGMAYWNTDIGGFAGEMPMPELYTRWIQFGAFTPIMRPHGAHQNREPWAFGDDVEEIVVQYIKLRYRLLPYTYNLAREANTTGLPFMRPLVLHYPEDRQTFNLRDQYLWGRDLLVAPVVTPDTTSRKVYLPAGDWFDFWTNRQVKGGRYVTAQAPLETLPIYVRAGAILPMAPDRLSTGGAWEALSLVIYPTAGTASYNLYEDDGVSTAFEGGAHAMTTFSYTKSESGLQVTIEGAVGSFAGQPVQRAYSLAVRLGRRPSTVTVGETTLKARRSLAGLGKAATGWWFQPKLKVLHVKLAPTAITTRTQIEIG